MELQGQGKRQDELRRLIRSLTKVSQVETREIRAQLQREGQLRNKNRRRRQVEADELLKEKKMLPLPHLLSSYKLFETRNNEVESLKERYIESQAYLKRAEFEYKKIAFKKQQVAHRQHATQHKYASTPLINHPSSSEPFEVPKIIPEEVDPALIEKLKATVHSSRKQMKSLYQSHVRQMVSPLKPNKHPQSDDSSAHSEAIIKPTQSVILIGKRKPKAVRELIRLSTFRSQQEDMSTLRTEREEEARAQTEEAIVEAEAGIVLGNKLKEQIVLGGLKKILYGDRRGRFIQDSTFRTRLKGEYSQQYMAVVQEQQQILNGFNGSYINRRNLVEKFANILGTLRIHQQDHEHALA